MSAKKTNKTRKPKSISAKVVTQCNYFRKNKLNLSRARLHKAVGVTPDNSTVDKYINKLKAEGFMEDVKDGVFKVTKEVPKDFGFNS